MTALNVSTRIHGISLAAMAVQSMVKGLSTLRSGLGAGYAQVRLQALGPSNGGLRSQKNLKSVN